MGHRTFQKSHFLFFLFLTSQPPDSILTAIGQPTPTIPASALLLWYVASATGYHPARGHIHLNPNKKRNSKLFFAIRSIEKNKRIKKGQKEKKRTDSLLIIAIIIAPQNTLSIHLPLPLRSTHFTLLF
jgi:hypothetical protein